MQSIRWRLTVALAFLFGAGLPAAPPAAAMVIMGGGTAIVVDGVNHCTLTTIGRDRAGDVVGFTAAKCGGPGATVAIAGSNATVGTVVAANSELQYAVMKFNVPDIIAVSDYAGFAINGIGPDPEWRRPTCKFGPVSGQYCNAITIVGPGPRMSMAGPIQEGEFGAPVTADGLLVGMAYGGYALPATKYGYVGTITQLTPFSAILADVNAGDGPGSGFVPVGN